MRSGYLTQTTTLRAPIWQVHASFDPCRHHSGQALSPLPFFLLGTPIAVHNTVVLKKHVEWALTASARPAADGVAPLFLLNSLQPALTLISMCLSTL